MRRTIWTARTLGAFIRGDLSRGTDAQCRITRFYVDRVEKLNLLEAHDMSEVPAHQRIHACDRGQSDVLHVRSELGGQNLFVLVLRDQPKNLRSDRQNGTRQRQDLLMKIPNH